MGERGRRRRRLHAHARRTHTLVWPNSASWSYSFLAAVSFRNATSSHSRVRTTTTRLKRVSLVFTSPNGSSRSCVCAVSTTGSDAASATGNWSGFTAASTAPSRRVCSASSSTVFLIWYSIQFSAARTGARRDQRACPGRSAAPSTPPTHAARTTRAAGARPWPPSRPAPRGGPAHDLRPAAANKPRRCLATGAQG